MRRLKQSLSFAGTLTKLDPLPENTHGDSSGGAMMFEEAERRAAIRLSKSRCKALICLSVPQLHQGLQDRIGRDLRALYGQLLCEPIPDRLIDLVERLGRAPRRSIQ
jgi:Anti-sigma factor NepR